MTGTTPRLGMGATLKMDAAGQALPYAVPRRDTLIRQWNKLLARDAERPAAGDR